MTLGQLMVCVTHNGGQVYINGRLPSECFIKQIILGCGGKIFTAADNMGDVHQVVIHNIGEVIGREAVCLHQNLVIQLRIIHGDITINHVMEGGCAAFGHFLANNEGFACGKLCLYLLRGQMQAMAVIFCEGNALCIGFLQAFQSFLGAEAVIRFALFHQLLCIIHIQTHAFALHIGAVFAADIGAFIMLKPCHFHGFINDIQRALHQTALIGILNTQDEFPTLRFCDEVFIKRSTQVADMHIARRGRGKSCSYFHFFLPFCFDKLTFLKKATYSFV